MILPKSNRLTDTQLAEITAIVTEFGCRLQPIIGAVRTIYAIVGDERDDLMINRLEGLDYVERIARIQSPFKLMDRRSDLASHRIVINGVTLGERLFVIAGACTIDPKNPNYFYETAQAVKEGYQNLVIDQQPFLQGYIPILNICLTKKFGFSGLDINTAGAFVDSTNVDAVAPLAAVEIR